MIEVRNLHVAYGDFALRDVSLTLREGGCLAILGPSGAGKSLLLETVMGARRPTTGEVLLDGKDLTALPPESRRIAYIPQDLALFPHLSVRENIVFGLRPRAARRHADDVLMRFASMLGIEHLLDRRRVNTLSGGEKQRVALARAMIVQPRVLFLDEPFSSLDAATASDLLWSLREMRRKLNITVFLVTHNINEASLLADEVAVMFDGRVVECGPHHKVFREPKSLIVARFLNIRNIVGLSAVPPQASCLVDSIGNGFTHLAIRPEGIVVRPIATLRAGDLRGRLDELVPLATHVLARLTIHPTWRLEAVVDHARAPELAACVGDDVAVSVLSSEVLYLK